MRMDNQDIYEKYEKSILSEATTGMRRRAQIIEDRIDDFFDEIEKKIDSLIEHPVFQNKMQQLLANTTKEHNEFIMALKQICQTLDSGSKTIPGTKPMGKDFSVGPDGFSGGTDGQPSDAGGAAGQSPAGSPAVDATNVAENVTKGNSIPHIQKVYTGSYKVIQSPSTSSWYVMGQTSNDNPEFVPVTSGFADKTTADDFMAKLKKVEKDQKQMVSNKWNEKYLKKNNEYRPNEM